MRTVYLAAIFISFVICAVAFGQTTQPIVATQEAGTTIWKLQTDRALYEFGVASDGIVVPLYYGPK